MGSTSIGENLGVKKIKTEKANTFLGKQPRTFSGILGAFRHQSKHGLAVARST